MNKTLNELAQEFALGKLDKAQYREARKELLSKILAGDMDVKLGDYLSPEEEHVSEDADVTKPSSKHVQEESENNEITQIKIQENANVEQRKYVNKPTTTTTIAKEKNLSKKLYFIFGLILILFLIAITVFFYPAPPIKNSEQQVNIQPGLAAKNNPSETTVANNLITTFLSKNIWTAESLNSFLTDWASLSVDEKSKMLNSRSAELMRKALYEQYLQEKAFSSVDPEKARLKQEKLVYFAKSLGLEDTFNTIR